MSELAQLLLPALRWDTTVGWEKERPLIEKGLQLGVGGFILFGGVEDAVRSLTKELRQRSRVPLLVGADLERGAGQQIAGATGLPPLAAIASLGDTDAVRRAARLTAREARTMGINWDYAPVCDLDIEPTNPIIGTRSLGSNPRLVAKLASEWIDACQSEGVLACAKHFPGHGRTTVDSHMKMPTVNASRMDLIDNDLLPFRSAIEAGVASIMTAHVAFPALDPSGLPATLSREMLLWLLRQQMKFEGLIVTDAFIMEGVLDGRSEGEAAIRALDAGCDVLLYPKDLVGVAQALDKALETGVLDRDRIRLSLRRRQKWAQWASPPNEYRRASAADVEWGARIADRVVHVVRGSPPRITSPIDAIVIDDDLGGPYPAPSRDPLLQGLAMGGADVRRVEKPSGDGRASVVVALFGDIRSWKGRPGYSPEARKAVDKIVDKAPDAVVMQFSHPRVAAELKKPAHIACAWGGDAVMQQAAARWLLRAR
ncbi:MAG TPA: glycoside hydrolase family 3 N-terminal domain-containing protein [Gemmatimonadaceae bacterium]|nr:glycoside hydrolase family 3 N-terminal domain-containing protein [Gemmatimonadaceae bacterium]